MSESSTSKRLPQSCRWVSDPARDANLVSVFVTTLRHKFRPEIVSACGNHGKQFFATAVEDPYQYRRA